MSLQLLQRRLLRTRDAVIFGLAETVPRSRDPDTGNHLERIAIYSTRLASVLHAAIRLIAIKSPLSSCN